MRYLIAVLALLLPTLALAEIAGPARVIDGDTIEISAQRVRLHGIDAPEGRQTCRRDAVTWLCGAESARALRWFIDGRRVTCRERDVDRYGRIVAVCHAGGHDLNGDWSPRGWRWRTGDIRSITLTKKMRREHPVTGYGAANLSRRGTGAAGIGYRLLHRSAARHPQPSHPRRAARCAGRARLAATAASGDRTPVESRRGARAMPTERSGR